MLEAMPHTDHDFVSLGRRVGVPAVIERISHVAGCDISIGPLGERVNIARRDRDTIRFFCRARFESLFINLSIHPAEVHLEGTAEGRDVRTDLQPITLVGGRLVDRVRGAKLMALELAAEHAVKPHGARIELQQAEIVNRSERKTERIGMRVEKTDLLTPGG